MNLRNRKVQIVVGICIAICVIIAYRIYNNIQNDRARAAKVNNVRNAVVVTAHPIKQSIMPKLTFSGRLEPVWKAELAAKVDGRLENIYVNEGDCVKKGQVLAVLEQDDTAAALLNAQGAYLDAQTNLRKAETDLTRYQKLFQNGAISQQVLDDYKFAYESAHAKLKAAQGILHSMEVKVQGTNIIAPKDGVIAKRNYQEGYYAKAGTAILEIADISVLKTSINIPEGQIADVYVGNNAKIKLPAYPDKDILGKITHIAPVADDVTHTFAAEVSVENAEGVLAGIYADVVLDALPKKNILTIPINAIVMRDDQATVFVADSNGYVKRVVLVLGYTDDKYAEILDGVTENDIIVVEGQNKLREGSKISLQEAGR